MDITLERARDLFERRRDAWLAQDVERYLDLFARDLEITMPGRAEPVRGIEPYSEIVRRSFEWAAPEAFTFHALAVNGDAVLAEWTISVRRREDGARFEWHGMSTARIDAHGRIARWREYWDPREVRQPVEGRDVGR
jgi:uncharacterized protein (TIGR02246 family)